MDEQLINVDTVVATFILGVQKLLIGSHVSSDSGVATGFGVDNHVGVAVRVGAFIFSVLALFLLDILRHTSSSRAEAGTAGLDEQHDRHTDDHNDDEE